MNDIIIEGLSTVISLAVGGLIGMAAYRSNQLHIKYNELKAEVNAAQTVEEVEAITWDD